MLVTLQTLSEGSKTLQLDGGPLQVADLKKLIAAVTRIPAARMKVVHRGQPLRDDDPPVQFSDGDKLLAVSAPAAPPKELYQAAVEQDSDGEEDTASSSGRSLPAWLDRGVRRVVQDRRTADAVLRGIAGVPLSLVAAAGAWLAAMAVANRYELGPIAFLGSCIALIYFNLGQRREGEASAYSIFNDNFQQLPGQLTADQLDDQVRRGQM